jgi:hypothetical protein
VAFRARLHAARRHDVTAFWRERETNARLIEDHTQRIRLEKAAARPVAEEKRAVFYVREQAIALVCSAAAGMGISTLFCR